MSNGNHKKKSKKKFIIWSIIGLVVVGLVAAYIMKGQQKPEIIVQTEKAQRRTITQTVTAVGKIQPEVMVKINAEVSGEIVAIAVKEGDRVRKGDLLVRIKADQYQAQVKQQEAMVNSQKTALLIQQAQCKKTENDYNRIKGLFEKNLASPQDMDLAKTSWEISTAQCESQQYAIDQAEASLKNVHEALAKTTIFSPMDGTISELISKLGERVSGSQFTQGTNILTVADLSKMEARVDVGETDVITISFGDTARIEVDAFPGKKIIGIVREIANTAKTLGFGTQLEVTNFEVKISLMSEEKFRPGMSATAVIETETKPNVLTIPIQSVTMRMKKPMEGMEEKGDEAENVTSTKKKKDDNKPQEVVFVIASDTVKKANVKSGLSDDTYIEILEGLSEGDDIVSGSYRAINRDLEQGSKIRVENEKDKMKEEKK
ncbi:MAG: efflux RND transporter periplasmic adaptor subunit [Ignavibacteriales bacterium]|nr:efflux RND transporter periplasmic adaptor subunit [Ignavibacteriales bacterium]